MIKFEGLTRSRIAGLGFAAVLASAAGIVYAQSNVETASEAAVESGSAEMVIQKWPKSVQTEARMLIDRYGQPGTVEENRLVWEDNGPWKRTVMHREGMTRPMIGKNRDHLEQVISREVPEDKVAELEKFDKRIKVDRAAGELSSRSDSERMNFLTLNLADDIVKGQRTAADARSFAKQVQALEKAGKSSPYLDGLIFTMQNGAQPPIETPDMDMTPDTRQDMEQESR
ncbi:MAG: hypothetical protein Q8T11_09665 [Elusimicrobiota bacterium]|nr:hypothetical protein [Elusimicrobiota bacterium]